MSETQNPYAAPKATIDHTEVGADAERIRREHINIEASVKAIGRLYVLAGVLTLAAGVVLALAVILGDRTATGSTAILAALPSTLALVCVGVLQGATGYGLHQLRPWARVIGTILSVIGLIGFPVGTIIGAYVLYIVWCKKGQMVFTEEYRRIIAATPHVKYKTSIVVWILLGLVLTLVALAFVMPIVRSW
jgi:hypothetical protein